MCGKPQTACPDVAWPRCGASAAVFRGEAVLLIVRAKGALKGLWSLPGAVSYTHLTLPTILLV